MVQGEQGGVRGGGRGCKEGRRRAREGGGSCKSRGEAWQRECWGYRRAGRG